MRPRILVLALPVVPFLPIACFSSSSGPPGPDAAVDDVTVDSEVPDSPPPEASPMTEASPPDVRAEGSIEASAEAASEASLDAPLDAAVEAGPQPVTVVVTGSGGPEAGVAVVFSDSAGALIGSAVTDATGRASLVVPTGSQATALLGSPSTSENLITFVAVEPGDVLGVVDQVNPNPPSGAVTIAALPPSPPSGTVDYLGQSGQCTTYGTFTSAPSTMPLNASCISQTGAFPMLVTANGSSSPVGFVFQNGSTLPTDGGEVSVSPPGPWLTPGAEQVVVTNASQSGSATAGYTEVASGVPIANYGYLSPDADGGASTSFMTHPGYPDFVQSEVNVTTNSGCSVYVRAIATRSTAAPSTAAFDLSQLLPILSANPTDGSLTGRPTASWTVQDADGGPASLASAAGTFVAIDWTASSVDAGSSQGSWTLVVPPTATSVTVPALTGAFAQWAPASNASYNDANSGSPVVVTVQGDGLSSYAALRQAAGPIAGKVTLDNPIVVPPLSLDGTLLVTGYYLTSC